MRLIDADAYSAEMKDRQEAAWKWRNEAIAEEDEVKLARAEGAFTAFTEAKLTMDKHIINPWHRVEEPPKEDGKYVAINVKTKWWYEASYENGNWKAVDLFGQRWVVIHPTHWMPVELPREE